MINLEFSLDVCAAILIKNYKCYGSFIPKCSYMLKCFYQSRLILHLASCSVIQHPRLYVSRTYSVFSKQNKNFLYLNICAGNCIITISFIVVIKVSFIMHIILEGLLGVKHVPKFYKYIENIIDNVYLEAVVLIRRDNE